MMTGWGPEARLGTSERSLEAVAEEKAVWILVYSATKDKICLASHKHLSYHARGGEIPSPDPQPHETGAKTKLLQCSQAEPCGGASSRGEGPPFSPAQHPSIP